MGKSRQRHRGGSSSYQPDNYPDQLPLPQKSRDAFSRKQNPNIGLLFERYTQFQQGWELKDIGKRKPSSKQHLLNELANTPVRDDEREAFAWRFQKMVSPAEAWQMTPTWRFVTGMGNKTALEVGFTFHRVYGFPYIPSSSLKGLARSVALLEIAQKTGREMIGLQDAVTLLSSKQSTPMQELEAALLEETKPSKQSTPMQELEAALLEETKTFPTKLRAWATDTGYEKVATLADQFRKVFGTQHSVGKAIFHDAIPAAKPTLEVDVMTVHYPDYYQGNKPPADTQNPTPIPFLTVGQTPFWFAVGWHGNPDQAAYDKAMAWLKFGLMEFGAGAKTAVGYGHFA